MYFMSTACGRPKGGLLLLVRPMWTGGGVKNLVFCGRHKWMTPSICVRKYNRVLYCIVFIHLYGASCSAHQSEALPVRETQIEESSVVSMTEKTPFML